MLVDFATKEDLVSLRDEMRAYIDSQRNGITVETEKEILRSRDVKRILGISDGTLYNLRVKGRLNPSKTEGIFFYKRSEVIALLNAGREL